MDNTPAWVLWVRARPWVTGLFLLVVGLVSSAYMVSRLFSPQGNWIFPGVWVVSFMVLAIGLWALIAKPGVDPSTGQLARRHVKGFAVSAAAGALGGLVLALVDYLR